MTLSRLYGLSEATRADRQITPAQIERDDPEAMAAFDRDVVGSGVEAKQVTFYRTPEGTITANVYGGGWWKLSTGPEPFWSQAEKPGDARGLNHHMKAKSKGSGFKAQSRRPEEWDSSICPECGYTGSGSYPEDCPNCGGGSGLQDAEPEPDSLNFDSPRRWRS